MKKFLDAYLFQMRETIQKKSFLISTLIMMAVVFSIGYFNYQSSKKVEKETVYVSNISDNYSIDKKSFRENLKDTHKLKVIKKTEQKIAKEIEKGKINNAYVISEKNKIPIIKQYYKNQASQTVTMWFEQNLKEQYIAKIAKEKKLDNKDIAELFAPIQTEYIQKVDVDQSFGLIYPMIYAMFIFIMGFGQSIAVNVVSEKSSKVTEILLPKIHPIYTLYSKILSALTTGLIQFGVLILSFWLTIQMGWINGKTLNILGDNISLESITTSTILLFVFFFVIGFLFYGLIYATLGSVVSKIEELNPILTPLVFLLVGALGIGMYSIFEPTSTVSLVSTYIPPFTPVVLFTRILLDEASILQSVFSLLIFFSTFAVITYFCQKWYKEGVTGGKTLKRKKNKK